MSVEKNRRKCNDITDIASNPNYCIADFIEASKKHEVANDEYSNLRKELDNVIETMLKHSLANLHDRKWGRKQSASRHDALQKDYLSCLSILRDLVIRKLTDFISYSFNFL